MRVKIKDISVILFDASVLGKIQLMIKRTTKSAHRRGEVKFFKFKNLLKIETVAKGVCVTEI